MGHQGIAINDMCEEDKIEGLHPIFWHQEINELPIPPDIGHPMKKI